MESSEPQVLSEKRVVFTPKALIHQKYGSKAHYSVEEVKQHDDNACPGLVIPQQVKILYRCRLDLPDFSVISDMVTRKKDAEQSAAKIAIEKLGIQSTTSNPTPEEASNELVSRISGLFTDAFLSSSHPLIGHFGVAFGANRAHFGMIPTSVIAACDVKVNNLCKVINCKTESNPLLVLSLILNAAERSSSLCTTDDGLWIWKRAPYSPETITSVISGDSGSLGYAQIEAIYIPCSINKSIEALTLDVSNDHYYLDSIAQKLNVRDASRVFVSRTVGKASSEMKLYFPLPEVSHSDASSGLLPKPEGNVDTDDPILNLRASYLSGQDIYGDAILACIGYSWKSSDLFYEDVSLCTYYRMLLAKVPCGHYKLAREAILFADLPTEYTGRSNWKGPTPRDLLCAFCRQNRLPEPHFSVVSINKGDSSDAQTKSNPSKPTQEAVMPNGDGSYVDGNILDNSVTFRCEVKILSRRMETILDGSFVDSHKKEYDAIQCSALKVLRWFDKYFEQLDMPVETLSSFAHAYGVTVNVENLCREFAMCLSVSGFKQICNQRNCSSLGSFCKLYPNSKVENGMVILGIEGPESGVFPSPGSLICISYTVAMVRMGHPAKDNLESKDEFEFELGTGAVMSKDHLESKDEFEFELGTGAVMSKDHLESKDEFEFELGTGAVIHQLEACVSHLSVNQTARFVIDMPSKDLILAAAGEAAKHLSYIPFHNYFLECSIKVLRIAEPLEERLEQSLFSPSLSKQRVEFAIQHINESNASTLVDFGCGSGSLLDSLLDHTTTLEVIVGVDISRKSLTRAAKILHQKLSLNPAAPTSLKNVMLYDGSITSFDSRLFGFDIGTCLEVIEHMKEDQACLFGDIVMSCFCPKMLIVSTPNYEYNFILQRSAVPIIEGKTAPCKFRNHDHKFEWTREQFQCWATDLSSRHNYSVEFSGVGGSAEEEPGFASQIAVFRRASSHPAEKYSSLEPAQPYELIWEWSHLYKL